MLNGHPARQYCVVWDGDVEHECVYKCEGGGGGV